jgi:hypothetical protein
MATERGTVMAGSRALRRAAGCLAWCVLLVALRPDAARAQAQATRPLLEAGVADAAGAGESPSSWSFEATPFLWLPEVHGKISARSLSASVDVDFAKLFDLLGNGELFAAGGHFEAHHDRFSLFLDAFGGTVRPTSNFTVGGLRSGVADVTINFTFFEFGPAYRILDWPHGGGGRPITMDLLTGGRFMYFYESIDARGSASLVQRSANATSTWVDPFVGGRFAVPLVGPLDFRFRGDIGGFGAGSQLVWNLIGGFSYALPWAPLGTQTSLYALYKALDFDYRSGGADHIVAKLDMRGPAFGLGFQF